jgi:hypothetical protein
VASNNDVDFQCNVEGGDSSSMDVDNDNDHESNDSFFMNEDGATLEEEHLEIGDYEEDVLSHLFASKQLQYEAKSEKKRKKWNFYQNTLSAQVTMFAHLLAIVDKHGGNKYLYNEIVECIVTWVNVPQHPVQHCRTESNME